MALPDSSTQAAGSPPQSVAEYWFDHACIIDANQFLKTITDIKAKGVRPDLISSIITHYASKWLPELANNDNFMAPEQCSPKSVTAIWMKKRFFIETLVGILPFENHDSPLSCEFMLRLLRVANMVGADSKHRADLEKRIAWKLDHASLKEMMIPSFSHTCATLLDVQLMIRLVKRFLMSLEERGSRSGAALVKVAKLVDSYLAEAAVDSNLTSAEFLELAGSLPTHVRATDDCLYRAIDTYLKAHPSLSKQERKLLCRLLDTRKLSPEAALHASQNERLPVRSVIQVLLSDNQTIKAGRQIDWSGSSSRSPAGGLRCVSKRELVQEMEIKKLKEDVERLQSQCNSMRAELDRVMEKKSGKSKGLFMNWKKNGMMASFRNLSMKDVIDGKKEGEGFGKNSSTTTNVKVKVKGF